MVIIQFKFNLFNFCSQSKLPIQSPYKNKIKYLIQLSMKLYLILGLLLFLSLTTSKESFDIDVFTNNSIPMFHIYNCDKDGASIVKRLASCSGAVADTRDPYLHPTLFVDSNYVKKNADKIVQYYQNLTNATKSPLPKAPLNFSTIVIGNPHRASLYAAEVLHAPLLPMQFIGWAQSLDTAAADGSCLRIAGSDFDNPSVWLWNKITEIQHFPQSYVNLIKNAENLVVVRSIDDPEFPEAYVGKYKGVYLHSSIKSNPAFLSSINQDLLETNISNETKLLHQWEWGLPDQTIIAVTKLWTDVLRKPLSKLTVIEGGTVPLFEGITKTWLAYLSKNLVKPRGISFNPYWTANPLYERYAGIVPLDFYNFRVTQDFAQNIVTSLRKNGTFKDAGPERIYAFMNTIEELPDVNCLKAFWDANNLTTSGWFSVGFDLYGIKSKNLNGDIVDAPYEKISKWMSNSTNLPYKNRKWIALTPNETIEAFKSAF